MAAQKADSFLLKVGDGVEPTEGFTTVAGFRTRTFGINREPVDVTTADNTDKWRELLAGASIQSATFSGDGVFKDSATEETIRAEMLASAHLNYQIEVPDFGTFEGPFMITSLEYAGSHDGEVTYSINLESAGTVTWTAAS